jgi:DNA-binding MarR family transcriptional regulator
VKRHEPSGYWYGGDRQAVATAVLNALRDYTASEAAMRRRTRDAMGMGENDMLALRHLVQAERSGETLGPKDLARRLGITSASTTALVDRLVASGHVLREPHPTDRRALVLRPTEDSHSQVRGTLGSMHERMREVVESMDEQDAVAVIGFLVGMRNAVESASGAEAGAH